MKIVAAMLLTLALSACAASGGRIPERDDPASGSPFPAAWPCNATG